MDWIKRNLGTVTLIAFAIASFLAQLAEQMPGEAGIVLAGVALAVLGLARTCVAVAELVTGRAPDPGLVAKLDEAEAKLLAYQRYYGTEVPNVPAGVTVGAVTAEHPDGFLPILPNDEGRT